MLSRNDKEINGGSRRSETLVQLAGTSDWHGRCDVQEEMQEIFFTENSKDKREGLWLSVLMCSRSWFGVSVGSCSKAVAEVLDA